MRLETVKRCEERSHSLENLNVKWIQVEEEGLHPLLQKGDIIVIELEGIYEIDTSSIFLVDHGGKKRICSIHTENRKLIFDFYDGRLVFNDHFDGIPEVVGVVTYVIKKVV